jgi:hypothetical protein
MGRLVTMRNHREGNESRPQGAVRRGEDDRRSAVQPSENPAPRSPDPDEDAVREGEEKLGYVKAY